jgi:hypothetical protein
MSSLLMRSLPFKQPPSRRAARTAIELLQKLAPLCGIEVVVDEHANRQLAVKLVNLLLR